MDLDGLTIGQAKQIARLVGCAGAPPAVSGHIFDRFIGRYCVIRASAAGVHAGEIVAVQGDNVVAKNCRRLWKWKANNGVALSGVAETGVDRGESKIDERIAEHGIAGVCEIIPCTDKAKESIDGK